MITLFFETIVASTEGCLNIEEEVILNLLLSINGVNKIFGHIDIIVLIFVESIRVCLLKYRD